MNASLFSDTPPVAVVIPCFNHGQFLAEALASVRAQTYPHVTCVIVDDGSTDPETVRTIDGLGGQDVRIIRQPNRGLAEARNTGIRATDTPFFVPLDADDRLRPQFIERLLPAMLADSRLGYCYSWVQLFGAEDRLWRCPPYEPYRLLLNNLSNPAAVVRRGAFDRVGGYKADMTLGFEDWDFWLALLSAGYEGRLVPEALFEYRKHAGGSMLDGTLARREEMIRTMIRHHHELYARYLGCSCSRKSRTLADPAGELENELYDRLQAAAELERIELSGSWRLLQRLGLAPAAGRVSVENPCERLARIRSSAAFRAISAVKRTRTYRAYARRRYGPDFLGVDLCPTSRT